MSEAMIAVEEEYHDFVVAMDDPSIVKTALSLAYYCAMLDAALADPMDDPADQEDCCARYFEKINTMTHQFQELVNDKL